ncbi:hypothetical protein [Ehrlichia ruminantium]|uniref:hypothetical protein n=1 Tax=Ehrlichia ruminantium TaxID=779 RepID=UPI001FB35BF5|nr:hypothetical protein [Ehrlichia ruminantium]
MSFVPAINWIIGVLVLVCGSNFQIAYSIINPDIAQDLDISLSYIALTALLYSMSRNLMWAIIVIILVIKIIIG